MKYPRTYHLPWSPGKASDDKVLQSTADFIGTPLIITEKLDGENMFTRHSIFYYSLTSFFYLFGVFDKNKNWWSSWDELEKI